jgi:hypothetical protein
MSHAHISLKAVLKKIENSGFGGPGLKVHVLKEHSYPGPVLGGEGRVYNITGIFLGAFNGFLAGEPRLGCRKVDFRFLSG